MGTNSEDVNKERFLNTPYGRSLLMEALMRDHGILDEDRVIELIEDNDRRGYLDQAQKIGANLETLAATLARQLNGTEPVEDNPDSGQTDLFGAANNAAWTIAEALSEIASSIDGLSTDDGSVACAIDRLTDTESADAALIADAILEHARAIRTLAEVFDAAFEKPIRIYTVSTGD